MCANSSVVHQEISHSETCAIRWRRPQHVAKLCARLFHVQWNFTSIICKQTLFDLNSFSKCRLTNDGDCKSPFYILNKMVAYHIQLQIQFLKQTHASHWWQILKWSKQIMLMYLLISLLVRKPTFARWYSRASMLGKYFFEGLAIQALKRFVLPRNH